MSRKFYACQCLFKKGREAVNLAFGKTIYVFKTLKDRNEFIACVYTHSQHKELFVLADIRQCYGDKYIPINEFA